MDHNHSNSSDSLTVSVTTKPTRDMIFRWVRDYRGKPEEQPGTPIAERLRAGKLYDVGIRVDGTLHNPNGYPEDVVRRSLEETLARYHEACSKAAKKAAVTRAIRRKNKINVIAKSIAAKSGVKPGTHCYVCGKSHTDAESIARGIGPECWQDVLQEVEWRQRPVAL